MRYVALAALVVLVGGYVVGQQPEPPKMIDKDGRTLPPTGYSAFRASDVLPPDQRPWIGLIDPDATPWLANDRQQDSSKETLYVDFVPNDKTAKPVGRYVPFGNDRLLDTTNGSLYRIDDAAWVEVVRMPLKAAVTQQPEEPQYEIVDDPDAK